MRGWHKLVASAATIWLALTIDVAAAAASDRILFNSNGPSAVELYIANADGTGERKLLATSALDYSPSFSRDGQWIVFTSERRAPPIFIDSRGRLRARAADGRPGLRRSGGALAGRHSTRLRLDARRGDRGYLDPGSKESRAAQPHPRGWRQFPAKLVTRRTMDRVFFRPRYRREASRPGLRISSRSKRRAST